MADKRLHAIIYTSPTKDGRGLDALLERLQNDGSIVYEVKELIHTNDLKFLILYWEGAEK